MKTMSSAAIRQAFLDYFKLHQHEEVPSSSLIPDNDPTLLFVNAGMVPFKNTFLGLESRPYSRAVSVQRCVRAGGKHNDLDQVGYTARHHTFFEMLGNFSFGDYFKREAIHYAWDFLTQILKLPKERLWITVYKDDDEAAAIWEKEIGVSMARFSRCGADDNFWSMGDTGPCGPCTEIFYDHGPEVAGGPPGSPEAEGDRYVEIWNLVFMQYNRDADGVLHTLAKPSIDTGMGLERLAAVMQHVQSNYDTDTFKHLKKAIQDLPHDGESIPCEHTSLNVIADHIRAVAFLMIDGVVPSNEGRGYVLRRIIRRAVRHGHRLKLNMPFLATLMNALVEQMGAAYPILFEQADMIKTILLREEEQFARTLEHGLSLLQNVMPDVVNKTLSGEVAFKLYDTYGFPLDLTQDILREQGIQVDQAGFEACMKRQRELSQSASSFRLDYNEMTPLTETTNFEGYTETALESTVLALRVDGHAVEHLTPGMRASVVLANTPFYAESGGQVGDQGELRALEGEALFRVENTQRVGQAILHEGVLVQGELKLQDVVFAEINNTRREAIRLNHTATHLLHAALKNILSDHVSQKGSLVDAERARFDFAFDTALTPTQLAQVEARVNTEIRKNLIVDTHVMSMKDALKEGAVALFGEKYDDDVRVLTMGNFSKELCGGTHAKRTGDLGLFKITAEYGVARGVRRVDFVTGDHALAWMNQQLQYLDNIARALKTTASEAPQKLVQVLDESKQQTRALNDFKQRAAADSGRALLDEIKQIQGVAVLVKRLDGVNPTELRAMLDQLKSSQVEAILVLISVLEDNVHVVASVSKSLLARGLPQAGTFVKALCGRGGGRDDMAQGGGPLPHDLEARMAQVLCLIEER